jgi:prophage regulatory protein
MSGTGSTQKITTLINRKTLLAMIPLSDRAIYNMEKRGEFPLRIVLTSRKVAWDLAEVEQWIEGRKQSSNKAIKPGSTATSGTTSFAQ